MLSQVTKINHVIKIEYQVQNLKESGITMNKQMIYIKMFVTLMIMIVQSKI